MFKPNQSLKILLVEDNLADVALMEDLLGSFSHSLFCLKSVESVGAGIKCLEAESFDAVLLGLWTPNSLGEMNAIATLKAGAPAIPVIVLTDIDDENTALSALREGAQDCLIKGRFQRTLLVRAIHYAIERQQIEEKLRQQAERERLLSQTIENIRSSLDLASILQKTVAGVRQFLKADRVLIYRCRNSPAKSDSIDLKSALAADDGDPDLCKEKTQNITAALALSCLLLAKSDSPEAVANVREAELDTSFKQLLAELGIAAVLSVPIWQSKDRFAASEELSAVWETEKNAGAALDANSLLDAEKPQVEQINAANCQPENRNYLWGMLTAYNCSGTRQWQEWEIDFLKHLTLQVAIAIEQSQLYRQLAAANERLQQLATTDGLTGIANRRQFDRILMLEWRRLAREKLPLSLIVFDIDFFKLYNDFYGHLAGDDCLRQVARAIASGVRRPADLAARYGGEEFAVVLPNTAAEGALAVARTIRDRLWKLQLPHERSPESCVTLSVGIATAIPVPHDSPTSLICRADSALFQAKAEGKNRIFQAIDNF
ncbi:MAG: diguanylate cyclase [Oscillatoriaceae cyanobacterium Prado104]|nr:diguanylate cyclase [Oscillatoriaceae cyanobacterium Prado104]